MRLKSIVINNLYSFGEGVLCTFPMEDYTKVLIVGVNNDEAGADSNGSGKSALLNCIYWTLFGEIFQSKENTDEIIRKGQKSGSATLTLVEDVQEITVSRGRGTKKFLKIAISGQDKTCNTDSQTQTELLKYLNIAPSLKPAEYINDFLNTCYFSSDAAKGFMAKETTSAQRFALVERYLGLKRYSLASDMAKEKRKTLLSQIENVMSTIAAKEEYLRNNDKNMISTSIIQSKNAIKELESAILTAQNIIESGKERVQLAQQLDTLKANLDQYRTGIMRELGGLTQQYNMLVGTAAERRKELADYNTLLATVQHESSAADVLLKEQRKHDEEASQINTKILQLTSELGVLNSDIHSFRTQLTTHYKCPKCQTALMVKDNLLAPVDIATLTQGLADAEQIKNCMLVAVNDAKAQLGKIQDASKIGNATLQAYNYNIQTLGLKKNASVLQKEITDADQQALLVTERNNKIVAEAEQKAKTWKEGIKNLEAKLASMPDTAGETQKAQQNIAEFTAKKDEYNRTIGTKELELKQVVQAEAELTELIKQTATTKSEADIQGFWETGFKEIKVNIIDEFLPDFEDKVNDFLKRLKVNMRVDFDTQKQRANATKKDIIEGRAFKEEFNVDVYKNEELLPFGMLSKGQRGRIGSCIGMALRELTKERGSNRFDFFFMDEIADALDESGLRELVSLLDETPAQKLVISHNDKLNNYFETVTTVEMTNGVSTIHSN